MHISTTTLSITLSAVLLQACSLQKIDPVNWGEAGATSESGGEAGDNATGGKSSKSSTSARGGSSTKPTSKGGTSNATDAGGTSSTDGTTTAPGTTSQGGATTTTTTVPSCTGSETRSCALAGALGTCANGTQTCVSGAWSECSIKPATTDNCTPGNDDTCNGKPNETPCKVKQISAGTSHTCALLSDGMVRCWGGNSYGQLGNGTTTLSATPVMVSGLHDVIDISAGPFASCAVQSNGIVYCWGSNTYGLLGIASSSTKSTIPVPITLPKDITATKVSVGNDHVCIISQSDGKVLCWGRSNEGQLGNGSTAVEIVRQPVFVTDVTGATTLHSGSSFSCVSLLDESAKCWGAYRGLDSQNTSTPRTVAGLDARFPMTDATEIATGPLGLHACVLVSSGAARCWGNNSVGQLGNAVSYETSENSGTLRVADSESHDYLGFVALTAGGMHSCGRLVDETAVCWGANSDGQLGNGTVNETYLPTPVLSLKNVSSIVAGTSHTCSILSNEGVYCWGSNYQGQLGDNSVVMRTVPTKVLNLLP